MAKFAVYSVSGGGYGRQLLYIAEDENIEEAEAQSYREIKGLCDGSCYEDYDDESGIEPECQCYLELEEVEDDAEIVKGRVFSRTTSLREEKQGLESDIRVTEREIIENVQKVQELEKRRLYLQEHLSVLSRQYGFFCETYKEFLE